MNKQIWLTTLIIKGLKYAGMGIFIMLMALVIGYLGYKLKYTKPKYQFEKTTTGRTVKFMDYNESKRYERNKVLGIFMILVSIIIFVIGGLILFFATK